LKQWKRSDFEISKIIVVKIGNVFIERGNEVTLRPVSLYWNNGWISFLARGTTL